MKTLALSTMASGGTAGKKDPWGSVKHNFINSPKKVSTTSAGLKVYFHHPSVFSLLHQESHLNYDSSSCFTEVQNTCYLASYIKSGLTPTPI